jgi:hypothetical protein
MLNTTTAKPHLIEIQQQLKNSADALHACIEVATDKAYSNKTREVAKRRGLAIAAHIGELKELCYQLAMTPEKVIYVES